jgi:tetratricopeptide (TPR) repeat protein
VEQEEPSPTFSVGSARLRMIAQATPSALERWLEVCVHLLELFAVVAGLILLGALLARLLMSIWRVTFRGLIAVLPFEGSEKAATVGQVLPQRWTLIERELYRAVGDVWAQRPNDADAHPSVTVGDQDGHLADDDDTGSDTPAAPSRANASSTGPRIPARLGPAPRPRPPELPDEAQFESLSADPIERDLSPITLAGMSVSPSLVLDLLRRIEAVVARHTIRGTVHEFSETVRLSVSVGDRRGPSASVEVIAEAKTGRQLLDAIDDVAFGIIKLRRGMAISMRRWGAYQAALAAYTHQLRFEWTAEYEERERAITRYRESLLSEPEDPVANYNCGTLLYSRYMETDTKQAIVLFERAAEAGEPTWRALALAGLAMSYCQLVHRYNYPSVPSAGQAGEASRRAIALAPDLEEVAFAEGFALQVAGRFDDAIRAYERTMTLAGDTQLERRLRSFAMNNAGWILMVEKGDPRGAKDGFERALELWPYNKMSYANLGDLHRRARDLDGAVRCYEKAMELDPEYINGANELGMIYIDKAGNDASQRDEWLRLAMSWHKCALSLISEGSERQEASVRARFAKRADDAGFVELAEELRTSG